MIEEFHNQLTQNKDLSQLLFAINQIPELPFIDYQPSLCQDEIDLISEILNQLTKVRQDKLNADLIQNFNNLIQQIPHKESILYQSCLEQHQRHVKSLDYHCQHELSNLSFKSINLQMITWLQKNCAILPEINGSIHKKFQELILCQLEQIQIEFDIQPLAKTLFISNNLIVQINNEIIMLQSKNIITKQSEMINILVGFLIFFDTIHIDLQEFLINTIASKYRQFFISQKNVIIDQIDFKTDYEQQIQQCLQKANLIEIYEKQSHYNQIDELKQNLVRFKETYINLLDQLQFKQQKQKNWKLGFFKTKTDETSKLPQQFFENLMNDWKLLDKFIINNTDLNLKQFELIFDHLRLLEILVDHKEIVHNFQSLNFYVTLYTQIDEKLMLLLKYWTSHNEQLIKLICCIKIKQRQYQLKANEFIDL